MDVATVMLPTGVWTGLKLTPSWFLGASVTIFGQEGGLGWTFNIGVYGH